jgi:hypothetical protein
MKGVKALVTPTARALSAELAATPMSSAAPAGVGLGTCVHPLPFHRSIRVRRVLYVPPTAQASLPEVADTPKRKPPPAGVGLGTRFHPAPFQRTIKVLEPVPVPV